MGMRDGIKAIATFLAPGMKLLSLLKKLLLSSLRLSRPVKPVKTACLTFETYKLHLETYLTKEYSDEGTEQIKDDMPGVYHWIQNTPPSYER